MRLVDKILGRSVRDLAGEVDEALGRLAQARGLEAAAAHALRLAQQDVALAQEDVNRARDALFREHPDLAPAGWPGPAATDQFQETRMHPNPSVLLPGQDPSKFEVVEVDDSDDPRFTAGASSVSPLEGDDLPPVVWEEHDA